MIDNWTLQDVETVLSNGLGTDTASEISIGEDRNGHTFKTVPEAAIQIDALLTLLTNVVCFDKLTVDSRFLYTWQKDDAQLLPLTNLGVVGPQDYAALGEDLILLREAILSELCVTPELKSEMAAIQAAWNSAGTQVNPHLSALVWGGAGMLARSSLSNMPYFGHPLRRRLLQETRLHLAQPSAAETVTSFLKDERSRMFRFRGMALSGAVAQISLPPLAVLAIEDSESIEQLIPAALNIRDRNAPLRNWISEYQIAIDEEDEGRQLKFEKVLREVSRSMQIFYGAKDGSGSGISLSTSFFKLDLPRSLIDRMRNSFGVRSALCSLVLAPRGRQALEKLMIMFGEGKSLLGRDVRTALQTRYSVNAPAAGA